MTGSRWVGEALHCQYDWSEARPSIAVMEAIDIYDRGVQGVSGGLGEPLYHYVDPDAFDTLVESQTPTTIALRLDEYHAVVSENTVRISLREPAIHWIQ